MNKKISAIGLVAIVSACNTQPNAQVQPTLHCIQVTSPAETPAELYISPNDTLVQGNSKFKSGGPAEILFYIDKNQVNLSLTITGSDGTSLTAHAAGKDHPYCRTNEPLTQLTDQFPQGDVKVSLRYEGPTGRGSVSRSFYLIK